MTKIEIRKNTLIQRNNLSKNRIASWSMEICDKIISSQDFQNAKIIHIYKSFGSEVDTEQLINRAFETGKTIVTPKIENDKTLSHWQIFPNTDFVRDKYGIENPALNCLPFNLNGFRPTDLIIVPTVAFDLTNNRVGYGKGFYDRFLSQINCKKFGIAFGCQLVENFEPYKWDIQLDQIIQN